MLFCAMIKTSLNAVKYKKNQATSLVLEKLALKVFCAYLKTYAE